MQSLLSTIKKNIFKLAGVRKPVLRNNFDLINEAVHLEKKCIFIAVPKTGSTMIRSQLKQAGKAMINKPHLNIMQVNNLIYVYFLLNALSKNRTFPTEGIQTDAEIRSQAEITFNSCFKFSSVRNPWARTVSLYQRIEGLQVRNSMTFSKFCEQHFYASDTSIHPTLHKNQYDWLSDENGTLSMDYIFKIEEFDKAITEIENRTDGRIKLTQKRMNVNPDSSARRYHELYNDTTKKMIASRFEKDIDYFKYTF